MEIWRKGGISGTLASHSTFLHTLLHFLFFPNPDTRRRRIRGAKWAHGDRHPVPVRLLGQLPVSLKLALNQGQLAVN